MALAQHGHPRLENQDNPMFAVDHRLAAFVAEFEGVCA
jgi:hypothetical protein